MLLLYDLLLHIALLTLTPYFLFKAITTGKYREGLRERFGIIPPEKTDRLTNARVVWFHAVSVGETKAAMPLVKRLREKHPELKILFSTVTPTGNAIALKEGEGWIDTIIFFPLDISWIVNRVIKKINPSLFIVVEKEIWPNILMSLKKIEVPVLIVNGNLSERSFLRYKFASFLFRRVFRTISAYSAQSTTDMEHALSLGVQRCMISGNIKFDLEAKAFSETERKRLEEEVGIANGEPVLIAGSTHAGEEEIVLDAYLLVQKKIDKLRLIIAPRHPERFTQIEMLIKKYNLPYVKRSDGYEGKSLASRGDNLDVKMPPVILLDTMGELGKFYSIADLAVVGGSLVEGVGGHNMLEPAMYRKPVLYGPYLGSWKGVGDLLADSGGGVITNGAYSLAKAMSRLLSNQELRTQTGEYAYKAAVSNRGATNKTLDLIEEFL